MTAIRPGQLLRSKINSRPRILDRYGRLRDAVSRRMLLAWSEFATLRQRLLKIGARVAERIACIGIHLASACPDIALFRARPTESKP